MIILNVNQTSDSEPNPSQNELFWITVIYPSLLLPFSNDSVKTKNGRHLESRTLLVMSQASLPYSTTWQFHYSPHESGSNAPSSLLLRYFCTWSEPFWSRSGDANDPWEAPTAVWRAGWASCDAYLFLRGVESMKGWWRVGRYRTPKKSLVLLCTSQQ